MTGPNHEQDLLARTLQERAGDVTGSGLGLDDVKGRARGIRRRHRVMTGAVAAVVLAVAVPVAMNVVDVTRGGEPLPTNPTPGLTDGPTVVDSAAPEPTGPIQADGPSAPRGEDPAVTYLRGSVVHPPGQQEVDLGRAYDAITAYGAGWLGYDLNAGDHGTTFPMDEAGNTEDSFPGAGLGVSSDGARLVYQLEATGAGATDLNLAPSDASETPLTATVGLGETVQPVGFSDEREFVYTLTDGSGTSGVYVTDFLRQGRRIPGIINARGANDLRGLVSGLVSASDSGSCWAVVEAATGDQVWDTCDFTLGQFSPDGRYVVGTDAYADGIGGSQVAIIDAATGSVKAEFTTRDLGFTGTPAWESGTTVLVPTYQDGTWYLLRLRPDGTVEKALDPVAGDQLERPWNLAVTP